MIKTQFELLSQYNAVMNRKIIDSISVLSEKDLWQDKGAFFGSISGTLNYILVGDLIWLRRFNRSPNHPNGYHSLVQLSQFPLTTNLDQILYPSFTDYKLHRNLLDNIIISFIDEVSLADIAVNLSYKNTKGNLFTKPFSHLLLHFFNHQTHHRGQVTTLLNQRNIDIGSTDLLMLIDDACL